MTSHTTSDSVSIRHRGVTGRPAIRKAVLTICADPRPPHLQDILTACSWLCHIERHFITGPSRKPDVVRARKIYYFVARMTTPYSLPMIGRAVGLRDHTTVMSGVASVKANRQAYEPALTEVINLVCSVKNSRGGRS